MIEILGPDGSTFEFADNTSPDTITSAMQKHYGPPKAEAFDRNDPRFQSMDTKAAMRGIPILGGLESKAAAAVSAAAHPLTGVGSEGETFGERYRRNLPQEEAATKAFEEEHPVRDAVSQMVGGTLALGGAAGASAKAAQALGMTGRLLPAMKNAALSGSAIGGVDALVRGGDPSTGAVTGAVTGAGGVLAGKLLGAGAGKVAQAFRREQPVPTRTIDVNGEQVPVPASAVTRDIDPALAAKQGSQEYLAGSGATGDEAQRIATQAQQATREGMQRAHGSFEEGLGGATSPEAAAATVGGDLVSQEAQRAAAEVARSTRAAADLAGIRSDLGASPAPGTPYEAGAGISTAIREGAQTARAARTAAYDAQAALPGEFNPRYLLRAGDEVRGGLNAPGDGRVRVSEGVTPMATRALEIIDRDVAGLQFPNEAARGARPITPAEIEQVRKDLVQLRGAANRAARQNGNWEDARAVGRVMDEFDAFVTRTAQRSGGFSGDAQAYLLGNQRARALHSNYRQAYSAQGPGDQVGRFIENVIGKYPGQELTPDAIVQKLFGSAKDMGGGTTVQIAQRLRAMFGERSPEWEAIRKAALHHLTDGLEHGAQAERILSFMNSTKGTLLSQTLFSPSERANLMRYANQVRNVVDPSPATAAERMIAKWSGRDGSPASSTDIVNHLFDMKGSKELTVQLTRDLKRRLSPDSLGQVKAGMWSKLTEVPGPDGAMAKLSDTMIAKNVTNFLKSDLAKELYTANERMLMQNIAGAHSRLVPIPGTVNTSHTAPTAAKLARSASKQLLGLFGFSHGGLPGAAAALGAGKALEWVGNRRAAATATKLFYGDQPKRAAPAGYQRALALAAASSPALRDRGGQQQASR